MLRLTLKNYRCFSDQHPLVIDYKRGFTALVGPNNSGKSAFLRFIWEHGSLWANLRNAATISGMASSPQHQLSYGLRGIVDPDEIVCDFTKRPIQFKAEWLGPPSEPHLESLTLTSQSPGPQYWKVAVKAAPGSPSIVHIGPTGLSNERGQELLWAPFLEAFEDFNDCVFAPAYRNAINEGSASIYEFAVGTAAVAQWNNWKAGANRASKIAIQKITADIKHIFGFRDLEINSSEDRKTLEVVIDGRPFRLNDLGSGLAQFILLFVNLAVKKPAMLLIDEPELNLHPSLQIDLLTSLASYTRSGSVIFATHSMGLARVAERIYSFTPGANGTIVRPLESTPNYAQFAGEMGFGSYEALGFKTILMVEGPTEIKAIQQFLRLLGHDHDVVILHLGGRSTITAGRQMEMAELRRITTKVAVLIDSEKTDQSAPLSADRAAFLADCRQLGFRAHATERRAFENYLTANAIRQVKGDAYQALSLYGDLDSVSPSWSKNENWRIARQMTRDELLGTDLGRFLEEVCAAS